ncbi:phytanoyl-CoA dioxygenase family protein [Mycolicibacterium psychrotolerans]|uniref:Phytanoyl-CoA dioxygenase n=1 Tax=Mycolicibacterium psychrotolerans TaxID=216929 RepID=A0A7I7MJN5_9MYCO|nr:phytanoyl-CoA dioxygenase family protein [Mycolicibacterium psychrotolerans]BBX72020.1 phytanoyl-CoA dioxygenase [Mycolicibacterium psychrotolerans]
MVDVESFETDGYVKLEQAAPRAVADEARELLWLRLGVSQDPATWTQPVVWTADLTGDGPFGELARSPVLAEALDAICGQGGWMPRGALGNIPVRFPVSPAADDRGWHIDLNTPGGSDDTWFVTNRPHTLLVLTLLSEVTIDDAPTRIRAGSHRDTARVLGDEPLDAVQAGALVEAASAARPVHHATGAPGDMYLLHPFTVHAADEHRGSTPRFMSQAPVLLTHPLTT